ncbi:hypothetical protein MSIM_01700 [Mycobacterium simiae]|nr:hypothetical protein MSIM_01700 [Mycobacterium simiae]
MDLAVPVDFVHNRSCYGAPLRLARPVFPWAIRNHQQLGGLRSSDCLENLARVIGAVEDDEDDGDGTSFRGDHFTQSTTIDIGLNGDDTLLSLSGVLFMNPFE